MSLPPPHVHPATYIGTYCPPPSPNSITPCITMSPHHTHTPSQHHTHAPSLPPSPINPLPPTTTTPCHPPLYTSSHPHPSPPPPYTHTNVYSIHHHPMTSQRPQSNRFSPTATASTHPAALHQPAAWAEPAAAVPSASWSPPPGAAPPTSAPGRPPEPAHRPAHVTPVALAGIAIMREKMGEMGVAWVWGEGGGNGGRRGGKRKEGKSEEWNWKRDIKIKKRGWRGGGGGRMGRRR